MRCNAAVECLSGRYLALTKATIHSVSTSMQPLKTEALWDEGISTFLTGEYEKKQEPLNAADLQHFATEQAVRVGDLLETLFLMVIYGSWHYCDENGDKQEIDEDALDELYSKGRIGPEDLENFEGVWLPAI